MLDGLRSFTSTMFGKIFFGIVALSFVAFGGFTALGGLSVGDVTTVGHKGVSTTDYIREINQYRARLQQINGQALSFEQITQFGIHLQVLDDLERQSALNALSDDLNLGLSQIQLIERMRNDPDLGGPTTPALFATNLRDIIAAGGFNENTFEQFYLDRTVRAQIRNSLISKLSLPQIGQETLLKAQRNQRSIHYVRINRLNIDAIAPPTEADILTYLNENQSRLQRPALRHFDIITLSPQLLAASIEVSDAQLATEFTANKDQYSDIAEQRAIKQVTMPDDAVLAQFQDGLAAGKDFDMLVEALDLGSDLRNYGTVTATEILDETIRTAAFDAELNTPVLTTANNQSAILLVSAINPARAQTLEDVRDELEQNMTLQLANSQINDVRNKIDNEIAAGTELSQIAEENGLTSAQYMLDAQGRDLEGNAPLVQEDTGPIMQKVFSTPLDIPSASISGAGASTYWIKVSQIEEQRDQTLEEARDTIIDLLTKKIEQEALETLAQSLVEEIKQGKSVDELAQQKNYLAVTSSLFTRDDQPPQLGAAVVQKAFSGDIDIVDWAEAGDGDIVVFKIAEHVDVGAEPQKENGQDQDLQDQFASSLDNDLIGLFTNALRDDFGVQRNEAAIEAVLSPQSRSRSSGL